MNADNTAPAAQITAVTRKISRYSDSSAARIAAS
jgi:hypothetical protein